MNTLRKIVVVRYAGGSYPGKACREELYPLIETLIHKIVLARVVILSSSASAALATAHYLKEAFRGATVENVEDNALFAFDEYYQFKNVYRVLYEVAERTNAEWMFVVADYLVATQFSASFSQEAGWITTAPEYDLKEGEGIVIDPITQTIEPITRPG